MIIVILQCSNTDITEHQPVSCGETYHTFCDSENLQTDIKEEEDPVLIFPVIKADNEVSCIYIYIYIYILSHV
jgi:hypothetical protein